MEWLPTIAEEQASCPRRSSRLCNIKTENEVVLGTMGLPSTTGAVHLCVTYQHRHIKNQKLRKS